MLFSLASMQMNIVARSWLAYDLSGAAFAIGLVAAGRGLPQFILAPVGGVAADRFDKRKLLLISQSTLVILSLFNAVLVHTDLIQVWHLVLIGMVQGIAFPFTMPTRTAMVPDLVEEQEVPNAMALESTARNINRVLAPALAGLMIAWNPTIAFYAIAIGYAAAVVTLFQLPSGLRGTEVKSGKNIFADSMVGFQYVWARPAIFALLAMAVVPILIGMPFQHLLPVFQSDVLQVGERSLGFMYACVGIGAITGSLVAAYIAQSVHLPRLQIACGVLFGITLGLFALSTNYYLSLFLLLGVGFTSQGYLTLNRMLVILRTDRALYGRVMSIYMMTFSMVSVSLIPLGALVDLVGVSATLATSGLLIALLIGGLSMAFSRYYLPRTGEAPATGPG